MPAGPHTRLRAYIALYNIRLDELKGNILNYARGEEWLRTKVRSLECGDGFRFEELLG